MTFHSRRTPSVLLALLTFIAALASNANGLYDIVVSRKRIGL